MFCRRRTSEEFIHKSKLIHGDKYDYSKVEYINNITKVKIICPKHGIFYQTPKGHLRGRKCAKCSKSFPLTTEMFVEKSYKIHGNKYDYSGVKYISSKIKVCIICKKHGVFNQRPNDHLMGCGCPKCANVCLSNTEEFVKKARKLYGNAYNYTKVKYINNKENIIIICPKHGEFIQMPNNHLMGHKCPKCSGSVSNMSQEWLDDLCIPQKYREKTIYLKSGRRIRVDAFDEDRNIIYEYDHYFWHGCQNMDLNEIHPLSSKKYRELYNETLKRRKEIMENGYEVVWTDGTD